MLFYTSIFLYISILTIVESFLKKSDRKYLDFLMIIVLALVSGFHGIGGSDMDYYSAAYNQIPDFFEYISSPLYFSEKIAHFEPGYILIVSCFKTVGLDFYEYIFCQSIIFYILMYVGLKRFTHYWGIMMLIFLYKMFIYDTFVAMRQELTIAGFFVLMPYLYERNAKKYFLGCTILTTIHFGAVILFPIYILNYIKLTRSRLIILLLVFLPTVILARMGWGGNLNTVMMLINSSKGEAYSTSTESLNIAYTVEYYLLMLAVVVNYKRIELLKYGKFIIKLCLVILPIVTLFSGVLILRREMDYFFPMYGIIGGYLCDTRRSYRAIILAFYIVICYYGFSRYLMNFDNGGMIPYKTWIETSK